MRDARPAVDAARALLTGAVTLVGLASLALALTTSSRAVPGPAGWAAADLVRWGRAQPIGATFRLLAALGLLVVVRLALGTIASTVAALACVANGPRLVALADRVTTPVVQKILTGALGVGLIATVPAPAHGASDGRATMRELPATDESFEPHQPDEPPAAPPPTVLAAGAGAGAGAPAADGGLWPTTWTIAPGDHLWGRSARLLAAARQRPPTEGEIAALVDRVVDLNRDRLVVRDQPDLVFPGQVFEVPAPD